MTISSLFIAKNVINHRHALARKLTHRDFPKGAYLLIHSKRNGYYEDNTINETTDYDEMRNDILTGDMVDDEVQESRHHKNKHSYRFRRNANTFPIDHCCPKINSDACGRYFCH